MEYNNKLYLLIVFDNRIDKKTVYLGYPFLRKYDMIFDIDKRHVGFYNFKIKYEYKKESETEEKNENENNKENKGIEKTDIIDNGEKNEETIQNNENDKNENNTTTKIIFSLLLVFFIILVIYCIFTVFRKCERQRKGKIFEELFL